MFKKSGISIPKSVFQNVSLRFKQVRWKCKWLPPQGYDTGIRIYNRIIDEEVPLIFLNKNCVKWYICGPTVYDVAHVGHASCYVRFDIIRRILEQFFGIRPVIALGITDIDDKIIEKSKATKKDFRLLAKQYEIEFLNELNELNVLPPSFILRVSEHIPDIIEFVSEIINQRKGYQTDDGSVYFDTKAFGDYGKFRLPAEEGISPLREGQRHFLDFALWKGAKPDEPYWESPWGKGRPGWHIECSAMASKLFGSQLDLHSGGIDLVFPHHENEEAQSCCYHNCPQWVNYWVHSGQLQVKQEKMSKSLFNYISISDFFKTYTADHMRMFCFVSSYSRGLHYGSDSMGLAVSLCEKISNFFADTTAYIKGNWHLGNIQEALLMEELEKTSTKVKEYLRDDFDTGNCCTTLMDLIRITLKMLNEKTSTSSSRSPSCVAAVNLYVSQVFKDFGFQLVPSSMKSSESTEQNKLEHVLNAAVNFRSQVRQEALSATEKPVKQKLLQASDKLREDFESVGIIIKDQGKNVSSWSLVEVNEEKEKLKTKSSS